MLSLYRSGDHDGAALALADGDTVWVAEWGPAKQAGDPTIKVTKCAAEETSALLRPWQSVAFRCRLLDELVKAYAESLKC